MPLFVLALAAYESGLLAGFSNSSLLIAVAIAAAFFVGYRRRRPMAIALVALVVAGVVAATQAASEDAHCLRDGVARDPILLVADDSIAPGLYSHAHLEGCGGRISVSTEQGAAEAGSSIGVRGVVTPSQNGYVIQHATVERRRGASLLVRWRAASGRAIDRSFGSDAPLVRALLIADRRELPPETRDRYAAAGLAHILAIAGLHIGIIALAIELALAMLHVPRRRAAIATVAVVVTYVAMIGAPVPAVRAASMLVALLASRLTQRPTSRWSIVALGGMQPVIDPRAVLDVGYQLSIVGVVAMMSASRLGDRLGVRRLHPVVRAGAATMLGATVATVATAPIVAWTFGRVSIVAPLSNLAAAPLIALAQPMIFCALVSSPIGPIARLLADAAHPLLVSLDWVATTASSIPNASLQVSPTATAAFVGGILSLSVVMACLAREWVRATTVAASAAALLAWSPATIGSSGMTELHMIDVGQGDAIALRTPHGHWVLFDAGRAWTGGDAGRSTILPYLGRHGGVLDLFVLSHPHTDHVGGAASILRALRPARYVDAGFPGPAQSYRASLDAARAMRVRWTRAHPGDTLTIDGVSLTFLAPDSAWTASLDDPNLASVVTLIRVGAIRMLLMGDAEKAEENWLLSRDSTMLHADILKVGHHGSNTSTTEPFLRAVAPRLALVSVGTGNTYHLPTPSVMRALAASGAQVLRTDRLGTIIASTDGQRIFVDAGGDRWEVPLTTPLRGP